MLNMLAALKDLEAKKKPLADEVSTHVTTITMQKTRTHLTVQESEYEDEEWEYEDEVSSQLNTRSNRFATPDAFAGQFVRNHDFI